MPRSGSASSSPDLRDFLALAGPDPAHRSPRWRLLHRQNVARPNSSGSLAMVPHRYGNEEVAMSKQNGAASEAAADIGSNVVRLRGRVSTAPSTRELPSGTSIVVLRLSVPRDATPMTKGSMQTSDWVDCAAWGSRARRAVSRGAEGDTVEVDGALRRRFFRGPGMSTRLEVEVLSGRLVER